MIRKVNAFIIVLLSILIVSSSSIFASENSFKVNYNLNGTLVYDCEFGDQDILFNYVVGYNDLILNVKGTDKKFSENVWGLGEALVTFEGSGSFDLVISSPDEITEKNVSLSSIRFVIVENKITLYINNKEIISTDAELDVIIKNNQKLAISGKDTLVVDFEKPMTIDEIKQAINLRALDGYDGDITSLIKVSKDSYSENKNKVGNYEILFTVKNSSGKTKEYLLLVVVMDFKKPIIEGPSNITISYKDVLTDSDIKTLFTVKDNYDLNLEVNIIDNKLINGEIGKYQVTLETQDSSKNKATHLLEISVIDDVMPLFVDNASGIIKINYKDKITDQLLRLELEANDEIDGILTDNIKVVKNNIKSVIGIYDVIYEVSDSAGNKTTYTRKYEVVSLDVPVFWVSKNIITIEEVNKMTIDQIADLISKYNNIEILNYEVVMDEYTGYENISGLYQVKLNITDKFGVVHSVEQQINVYNSSLNYEDSNMNYLLMLLIGLVVVTGTTLGIVIIKKRKVNK
ncbi:DUF5011/hyalin repeat domain-containing protein [Haploplasma modicum]|uniref:hypothetical protein n=1 Tax=Haploplasma modicum TaxID=2150 RepID=UPI00047EC69E|nr:hypothetical protein [Haploplasma modicum]